MCEVVTVLLFLRIVFWQPVLVLAFNHCACRRSAGCISHSRVIGYISIIRATKVSHLPPPPL